MSSRSSSSAAASRLEAGRVSGRRGTEGEITVRVADGDASFWVEVERVWLGREGQADRQFEVEASRAYRDRWVLKLGGIDDAGSAEELRGARVWVAAEDAPELGPDEYYAERLVGMDVADEDGQNLGRVEDLLVTGGVDLLVVRAPDEGDAEPLMIPLAKEIVRSVDEETGSIVVRLPTGLLELNREG